LKILGIETSSPFFSLCINEDETIIHEIKRNRLAGKRSRDAQFFTEAKMLVDNFQDDIGAIAVSIGPGMFTSLRIGLSLAKGFALAQKIPVVTVNTLDVIGISLSFVGLPVLAAINAYHQEIYAALYKNGKRMTDYLLTTPLDITKTIKERTVVIGTGIEVFKKNRKALRHKNLQFIEDNFLPPSASRVVKIALPRISAGEFDAPELLEPFYIKRTDAERNYNKTDAL
jgi:tRNA threonylcarbamoyladenosine biosynthesis protein TsaB